jgi:hypothetical protein
MQSARKCSALTWLMILVGGSWLIQTVVDTLDSIAVGLCTLNISKTEKKGSRSLYSANKIGKDRLKLI